MSQFLDIGVIGDSLFVDISINGDPQYIDVVYQNVVNVVFGAPLPISNNSDVELTPDELNAAYPNAQYPQLVTLANVPCKYQKMDNSSTGVWELQPYNPIN